MKRCSVWDGRAIPTLGMIRSQHGSDTFPAWEWYVPCMGIRAKSASEMGKGAIICRPSCLFTIDKLYHIGYKSKKIAIFIPELIYLSQ